MTDRIGVSGRWCWTVLALAVFCLESQASNHATGLMEVYGLALEYDPTYHAAMKERDAGLGERAIGRAALLPKLSLQYQSGRNESEVTQPGFFGSTTTDRRYRSYSSSLTLEQPIIDYEAISRYYRGVALAHHTDARFRSRSQELAVRVTQAYTEALYANDQIELAQAQKRAFAEQMKLNGRRLQVGEGTRTDMLETQARYDLAQAQEIEAQDNADAAMRDLIAMVGQPLSAQDLAPLAVTFEMLPLELNSFEAWRDIALLNNPELASLRYALDAADEQIEQARAGHLPKVSLYATAGRQKSSSESTFDQRYVTNSVGIQVSVPIFAGGGVSATVGQAVDNSGRLRYENDAKLNEVMNDLHKQFNLYNSSFAKMRAFQLAVNSAQELTVAMKKSVAGGERVNSDILDAEQRYYDALRNLAQARYAYLTSWLKIRFLAGKLSDVDISILAQCFDGKLNSQHVNGQ
ncbi:TolC family outer membrane protein [Pseudomonas sp. AM8]|uniref:TolC family outer membrane protein n=1 Tax=Pseudomonas sp. AM8 TaxID=2983368 RepID=UPI002E8232BA|nr:TolC family outer membrane protein [Pseudomonas sp. AM8]